MSITSQNTIMNKNKFPIPAAALVALTVLFAACEKDGGKDNVIPSYTLGVSFTASSDEISLDNVSDASLKISRTSGTALDSTVILKDLADTAFTLPQGSYTLLLSGKITNEATGYVSASANIDLYQDVKTSLTLSKYMQSSLIFKAIYTTGGVQGYVKDSYFEIVNNSDEVQYLDGIILMKTDGGQNKEKNTWQENGFIDRYVSGQGCVVAFPASESGKEIPLEPGKSVVVANDAANHSTSAKEGNFCPDLSGADWEVYQDYIKDDIDYEDAKNMDIIHVITTGARFAMGFFNAGYIMARLPEGMTPKEYAALEESKTYTPGTTGGMQFFVIPSKYVLDAVDMWKNDATETYIQFLSSDDAAGVPASQAWAGKCIRRKVTKVVDGRAYYKDTNNSAEDFLNNQPLQPGYEFTEIDE